jgi:hypothetical protein
VLLHRGCLRTRFLARNVPYYIVFKDRKSIEVRGSVLDKDGRFGVYFVDLVSNLLSKLFPSSTDYNLGTFTSKFNSCTLSNSSGRSSDKCNFSLLKNCQLDLRDRKRYQSSLSRHVAADYFRYVINCFLIESLAGYSSCKKLHEDFLNIR